MAKAVYAQTCNFIFFWDFHHYFCWMDAEWHMFFSDFLNIFWMSTFTAYTLYILSRLFLIWKTNNIYTKLLYTRTGDGSIISIGPLLKLGQKSAWENTFCGTTWSTPDKHESKSVLEMDMKWFYNPARRTKFKTYLVDLRKFCLSQFFVSNAEFGLCVPHTTVSTRMNLALLPKSRVFGRIEPESNQVQPRHSWYRLPSKTQTLALA